MKKNYIIFIVLFGFIFSISKVEAMRPSEILNRVSECSNIELATANSDGSLTKVECYNDYQSAKTSMNNTDNDDLVIIENGVIIDSKYAVIDYDIAYPSNSDKYITIYTTSSGSVKSTYIATAGNYADDAVMLDYDYNTKRVKIKVAGITGWIDKNYNNTGYNGYDIVPLSWVKTPNYYIVENNALIHELPKNVYGEGDKVSLKIDKKPSILNENTTYYSYDGNYFYTSMKSLIQDYKNGNYNQSVNKDNPYYNYYQYVSFRIKTSYSIENLNQYFEYRTSSDSKLRLTGEYFIEVQEKYGVNAALMVAIGMNESNRGRSNIALSKNNLFGLNAIDKSAYESATGYNTVYDCIIDYGYGWLAYGFLDPRDYRFYGANLGNKYQGLNYKYASDPYWAEKAVTFYYDLDSLFDFQDYGTYDIAVLNNDYSDVYAKKTPGGENISLYQYKYKDSSIVIIEEVEGPEVNGTKIWYKIQSDGMLDDSLNIIGSSKDNPKVTYNWDKNYVYVSSSYFTKINKTSDSGSDNTNKGDETKKENDTKTVEKVITDSGYKYDSSYISGIKPNTQVDTIKNNLTNNGGVVTITDYNGNNKASGNIGTGDKISITSDKTITLTVLIYGDTNGDGNISAVDYVNIKNHIMGTNKLDGAGKQAADVNKDGNISAVDYVNIKNYIMGTDNVINN